MGPNALTGLSAQRDLGVTTDFMQTVETDTTYNFMGNPMTKTVIESRYAPGGSQTSSVSRVTGYAYWDQTKFFQQKAFVQNDGRVLSYTDYNLSTATNGPGQTCAVYEAKYGGLPYYSSGLPNGWQTSVAPAGVASATFLYDTKGRVNSVKKLRSSSDGTYVTTTTAYGADNSTWWGEPQNVVEDAGGLNRTTTTNAYDSIGRSVDVTGPTGRFVTAYDGDGLVQSVTRVDVTPNVTVASYTYGTPQGIAAGTQPIISNGQPLTVTDGLTTPGIVQTIVYDDGTSGLGGLGGVGQPYTVSQSATAAGTAAYGSTYTYTAKGERQAATYTTPNGDSVAWLYTDFLPVGSAKNAKRAFQTLVKLSSTSGGVPTAEEEHYAYDTSGRLTHAAFAQTPAAGFTPTSGNSWYNANEEPSSRCHEFYDYDPAGRLLNLEYFWETFNPTGAATSTTNIVGWNHTYENTGAARGLKLTSSLYNGSGTNWNLDHTENYGYENERAFLTSADYNDGQPNPSPTWTYDESQNRNDVTTNNLNQVTLGGVAQTDLAGRLLNRGSATLAWDCESRLLSYTTSAGAATYEYRADGMRTHRHLPGTTPTEWSYYQDGQTTIEDEQIQGTALTATRYALGARGIDYAERQSGTIINGVRTLTSPLSAWFPVYDGHGNQVATLSRAGAGSYSVQNQRTFDAWGNVRRGATTGDPASRHCGSVGHVQDDESGLIYMRARFYDPTSGRFVSEDHNESGANWFNYAACCPTGRLDRSGKDDDSEEYALNFVGNLLIFLGRMFIDPFNINIADIMTNLSKDLAEYESHDKYGEDEDLERAVAAIAKLAIMMASSMYAASDIGDCNSAISAVAGYEMVCYGLLLTIDGGDGSDWGLTQGML